MTRRKQYKNRLPTVLPPAPRPKPPAEQRVPRRAPPAPRLPEPAREPEPVVEADSPRSRPRWVVPIVAAALVLLVGVVISAVLYLWLRDRDAATPEQETTSTLTAAGLANVPPGAPAQGSYLESVVRPDETVEVRQWIRSEEPIEQLVLALPRVPGNVHLTAEDVVVVADGEAVAGPGAITDGSAAYAFAATTDVRLAYVIAGAVERSDSAQGRALAAATNLTVRTVPRPRSDVRVVRAPQVLSLACTPSLYAVPAPCGTRMRPDAWRVQLDRDEGAVRVVAQVTLDAG